MAREKNEKLTKKIRKNVSDWRNYFKSNNNKFHYLMEFVYGTQWKDDESEVLTSVGKPAMTFNKLLTLVNTISGEQQHNTPQIEIVPKSQCDEETAQIRTQITKDIMLGTQSRLVYQRAAHQAFIGGYSAYLIDTDYESDYSFDLDIVYRNFKDPTLCYWDVGASLPDKTDGMYCGYGVMVSREHFKRLYGKDINDDIKPTSNLQKPGIAATEEEVRAVTSPGGGAGDLEFVWQDENSVMVVHHFRREFYKDMLYKLSNGEVLTQDELDELIDSTREEREKQKQLEIEMLAQQEGLSPEEIEYIYMQQEDAENDGQLIYGENKELVTVEDSKEVSRSKIMHSVTAGDYVLEDVEFPSEDLPLIFVDQNSYYTKRGKQVTVSIMEAAIDPQRYINYIGTQSAYVLKMSRYDQYIGSKDNVRSPDIAAIWKNPSAYQGMLAYDPAPDGSRPEQIRPPELPVTFLTQFERAVNDLYEATGIFPAKMGQDQQELSGVAINARTRQGSYPTSVYLNAINDAITAGGKILNQMIPRVYDTQRVITMMTPERGRQSIAVNVIEDDYGEIVKNNIRKGRYDVVMQAGPSYEGQKEQAIESLQYMVANDPSSFTIVADLIAENLPMANTIEIKNRFKTRVPKEIIEAGKTGKMPEETQTPSAQDQALIAQAEAAQMQAQINQQELQLKQQELQLKIEVSQAELEMKRMEMEIRRLEAAAKLEEQKLRYAAEADRTRSDNQISHANNLTKILTTKMKEEEVSTDE